MNVFVLERKPIIKLKVVTVPSLHRLFVLSDNFIQILDSDNLQPIPNIKLKNVLTFCISNRSNQDQTAYIDICVSIRKNKVQIYRLDKTNIITSINEISIQDSFISISMDDHGIMACTENEYFSYNPPTSSDRRSIGSFNSIFELNDPNISTCFTNISPGQYLLNGPHVGVTTSLEGTSQRAPIMFTSPPLNFIYSHPYLISMDDHGIMACTENEYFSYNPPTSSDRRSIGSFNSIFELNDPNISTCFTNISPGQYLLNGPHVGVTTSLEGTSQRAPIMFTSPPLNFIYSHPYLIVLVKDYIQIYSYLDDKLKQEILKQCRTLTNMQLENLKTVILTDKDNIYLLEPLGLEEQIDQLLNQYRLQEALTLAESNCSLVEQRRTNPLVLLTKKRIAFIEFGAMNVVRAVNLFVEIHIDFHEIISQIPNFLPLDSSWPAIDENLQNQYTQWLNAFCDYMTKKSVDFSRHPDYYPALLKAYILIKSHETVNEFIETNSLHIPVDYTNILIDAKFYHAAALLSSAHQKHEQAINIWKKLISNEYSNDETFPGIWIIAKYIIERNFDRSLEFSTAEWLLERHEEDLAIKIFTSKYKNESNNDPFSSDRVINILKKHSTALVAYLEYAVFKLKLESDQIHTMLVNIYLDQILSRSDGDNEQIRSKLQAFIITSNSYRVQTVLNRVNQTNRLRREVALLNGKMNNFDQAFRILIDELEDFEYAENYCITLSQGKSSEDRKIVAHILFKVLLNSLKKNSDKTTQVLLHILCNNEIEFDFIEVLQQLPSHWSLASLSQILLRALRTYSYTQRSTKIESALVRVQNERLHTKLSQLKSLNTLVNEHRQCKHCLQHFYETSCVVYQDGSQGHVHCAKKYNQKQ
ncbi:unnamed protein product [Adineta steineri]|uniref:CNH domain-containing protein n=1 Tax=Adineta steineri TaxID=433720 RepID=A0A814WBC3_9BILA|nr:unnamed protein product [Adineta steineri]